MLSEDAISLVPGSVFTACRFWGWCLGFRMRGSGFGGLGVCCLQVGPLINRGILIRPIKGPSHVIGLGPRISLSFSELLPR